MLNPLFGISTKTGEDQIEREKRAEERFQAVVTGLGDEKEGARIGAAILLRTFLRPGYEQFYIQAFDLAVANLRLPRTSQQSDDPDGIPNPPEDLIAPSLAPVTTLSQALVVVLKEAFPLARNRLKEDSPQFSPQSLDASRIQLDNAYLSQADLEQVWMPQASLRKAMLGMTKLSGAKLIRADLSWANLSWADLSGANLSWANLSGAHLYKADLSGAKLTGVQLRGVQLENSLHLKGIDLRGVKGLTKEQLVICKAKGAIIDEVPTTSSSQPTIAPPPQSNGAQTLSAPPAQGSVPPSNTGGSSAASSQQDSES